MKLKYLNEIWSGGEIRGEIRVPVDGLAQDSRLVKPDYIFFAIRGLTVDGHAYIQKAIERGASVVFCEAWPEEIRETVTYVKVSNSRKSMALIAKMFFDNPSNRLRLVGVTGTNGKTTVVTLLHQLFIDLGYKVGLLSTIRTRINKADYESQYTTPDVLKINELLSEMADAGCDYVFMEVSSHAVKQKRIQGLEFAGAIFTNLTHDHLDYHKTFDDYIRHKKMFFDHLPSSAFALVNVDDRRGEVMIQNTKARKYKYSFKQLVDFHGKVIESDLSGLKLRFNEETFHSQLIGRFNAYNLLAVYGASFLLGAGPNLAREMSMLIPAAGRMDRVNMPSKNATAFVDYAHTPDALKNVLKTISQAKPPKGKLLCVVGCGGDRDKAKRPKMGAIATEYCDWVIFTSDNPRGEDPDEIIRQMEAGVSATLRHKVISITDRLQAIRAAYRLTEANDVMIVAGKGHEPYQEIEGKRHPFDDKKIILELSNEDI